MLSASCAALSCVPVLQKVQKRHMITGMKPDMLKDMKMALRQEGTLVIRVDIQMDGVRVMMPPFPLHKHIGRHQFLQTTTHRLHQTAIPFM